MGVTYLICPPEQTSWHVDLASFAGALPSPWPQADVDIPAGAVNPTRAVTWTIASAHSPDRWLGGSLDQAGQASYLRGHPELVADYALWLRVAGPTPRLVLVSDANGALLPLLPATTAQEVIEFVS